MRRGIFSAEVYKLLISSRCIFILVLLFAVKCVISANILTPKPSFTDDCYREYMTELAGPADEKTRERVFAIRAELNDIILRADEMERALESGEISAEEYSRYLSEYSAAAARDEVFKQVEEHLYYIDEKSALGQEAQFVYDTGWQELFFTGFDYTLYAAIIITASGAFTVEHEKRSSSGEFAQVLRATPMGRRRTFAAKFAAALTTSLILAAIWNAADAVIIANSYELPLASAPLISIETFSDMDASLTVGQYTALFYAVRLISHAAFAVTVCALSEILKKTVSVLSVSVIITLLPDMAARLGAESLSRFGSVGAFRATPLLLASAEGSFKYGHAALFLGAALLISAALTVCAEKMWSGK